jgi:hypothetical protein
MTKKEVCINTDYTNGFRITVLPDGTFVGVKGKNTLKAPSAKELYELITTFNKDEKL